MKNLLILLMVMVPFSSFAQEESPFVQVEGECVKKESPDLVSVTFTVDEKDDKEVSKAVSKMNKKYNQLLAEIKKLELKDLVLRSDNYQVQEVREWEKDKNVFKGYRAGFSLTIETTGLDKIALAMEKAGNLEITQAGGLVFKFSSQKEKALMDACLEEAAASAKDRAQRIVKGLGGELLGATKVVLVSSGTNNPPPMPRMYMKAQAMESSDAVSVEAGKNEIQVKISVTFGYKTK